MRRYKLHLIFPNNTEQVHTLTREQAGEVEHILLKTELPSSFFVMSDDNILSIIPSNLSAIRLVSFEDWS